MKNLKDTILEKLKVNTKNVKTQTTKIPDQISRKDREEFDKLWQKVSEYAHIWDLHEDDDLDDAVKYYKEIADPKYFNKELSLFPFLFFIVSPIYYYNINIHSKKKNLI